MEIRMARCKSCKLLIDAVDISENGESKYKWCPINDDCPDIDFERECDYYEVITNAGRIRNMTDEELAGFLVKVNNSYATPCMTGEKTCKYENCPGAYKGCKDCFEEWLQSPAEV